LLLVFLVWSSFVCICPSDFSHNTPFFININIKIPTERGWWEKKSCEAHTVPLPKPLFVSWVFYKAFSFCFSLTCWFKRGFLHPLSSWRDHGCCVVSSQKFNPIMDLESVIHRNTIKVRPRLRKPVCDVPCGILS